MREIAPEGFEVDELGPPDDKRGAQDTVRGGDPYGVVYPASRPPIDPLSPATKPAGRGIAPLVRVGVIVTIGAAVVSSFAGSVGQGNPHIVTVDRAAAAVEVDAGSSEVRVVPGEGERAQVELPTRFGRDAAEVKQTWQGDRLALEVDCTAFFRCGSGIVVRVPGDAPVQTRSSSGDVTIDGLKSDVVVRTSSGGIDLRRVRSVQAEASSGDVDLDGVDGDVQVRTSSGNVDLDKVDGDVQVSTSSGEVKGTVRGKAVEVDTSSGNVNLGLDASVSQGDVETRSGSIHLKLNLDSLYDIDPKSSSGDVEVRADERQGSRDRLKLRSSSGDIRVEY